MTDPVAAMLAADRASRDLGIEVVDAGPGRAKARMAVTGAMVNGHGLAHGAFVFAVADTAFACACNSHGPITVAAGADITFVVPVREGDELVAEAVERTRKSTRLNSSHVEISYAVFCLKKKKNTKELTQKKIKKKKQQNKTKQI